MAKPVITDEQVEEALRAFHKGPPGVVRKVELIDSYPGEYRGDPQAYNRLPCTRNDEVAAMRSVLEAYEHTLDPNRCPQSQQPDGSHCTHSWSHDECCWCGRTWGESGCRLVVAKDPVREAARQASAALTGAVSVGELRRMSLLNAEKALREALAKPAPPSLTERERKEVVFALDYLAGHGGHWESIQSAREKLVYDLEEKK